MEKIAIIMAGGAGERFWPFSRRMKPKQLLALTGGKSMLAESLEQISRIVPVKNCYIVTNIILKNAILKDVPEIPERNILCEPVGKNTAACLGFASAVLAKKYDDCAIAVVTADHLIKGREEFINNVSLALEDAEKEESIVTFGIPPNRPETGYGYIQTTEWLQKTEKGNLGRVKAFHEKPNLATAQKYLESGDFFWNSGMFFYRNSTMIKAFQKYMPNLYNAIIQIRNAWDTPEESKIVADCFSRLESISIDNGIMEKFHEIRMVKADFYWDDIGSWTSLDRLGINDENGNVVIGDAVLYNTKNTIAFADKSADGKKLPMIGVVGVENLVVVVSGDCVLVCPKDKVQEVKKIVSELKAKNKLEHI